MCANPIQCLKDISNYLKVPLDKLTVDDGKLPTCNLQNKSITGFINIIQNIATQSKSPLMGSNLFEQAQVRQWLQYCMTYGLYCNNQILEELNNVLAKKTYFVGSNLTMADLAMFYILQSVFKKMPHLDKENYLNVSRWFDNIQQNDEIRKEKSLVDFSTIFLSLTLR